MQCMFLNILAKSKITLIIHQIENSYYATLVSICFQNLLVVPITTLLQTQDFEEVTVLITICINRSEYPIDSSIASYCSQPFEFVRNILYDKSILMSSFDVHI